MLNVLHVNELASNFFGHANAITCAMDLFSIQASNFVEFLSKNNRFQRKFVEKIKNRTPLVVGKCNKSGRYFLM
jgi:hypothetical protein